MLSVCMALIDDAEGRMEFENIVKNYEKKLYGIAYGILHNSALAEEAVWESFFAISKCFEKIRKNGVECLEAYIIITLKNCCFKIYRNEKKYREQYDNSNEYISFSEFENCDLNDLCDALRSMKSDYQSVIAYMLYYEYTAEETSELMGISRSTVYKYLSDAKKILREKLGVANEQEF